MNTRSGEFPLYVMLIMKITVEVPKSDRMQEKHSSPSHRTLNIEM
jgi:hypothetical protein